MTLEGVGVTEPARHGPSQIRLKFGKQRYCLIELRPGEESVDIAKKPRELRSDPVPEKKKR